MDSTRKYAPLMKADGVVEIDSSDLTLDEVVGAVLAAIPPEWREGEADGNTVELYVRYLNNKLEAICSNVRVVSTDAAYRLQNGGDR